MKNPFRTLTLNDEVNIAINRLRRTLLQLQLEKIDRDQAILSIQAKIKHLSRNTTPNGESEA